MAVEQIVKGATSVEDRLKDVLKHLESEFFRNVYVCTFIVPSDLRKWIAATKSRIAIVPEELREALQKISSREEGSSESGRIPLIN